MKNVIILMVFSSLLTGCHQQQLSSVQLIPGKNTFGDVDKVPLPKNQVVHPYDKVGRLGLPNGQHCSASLVGKNLILTAGHCILNDNNQLIKGNYQFYLGYDNGSYLAKSSVNHAWWSPDSYVQHGREHDWAIMRLDERLGEQFGYFGTTAQAKLNQNDLIQAGYGTSFSAGEQLSIHENCSLRKKLPERQVYYHDCDTSRGDSGGPMFRCDESSGICYIVAVNVAEFRKNGQHSLSLDQYSDEYANVAYGALAIAKKLTELKKENP